jgi:hypothetical protein
LSLSNHFIYFFKAPWRVPGYFEIPDIIKETWERNKHKQKIPIDDGKTKQQQEIPPLHTQVL